MSARPELRAVLRMRHRSPEHEARAFAELGHMLTEALAAEPPDLARVRAVRDALEELAAEAREGVST